MEKNSGTRSGLLWEVERLLNECTELPQILLMENVPQVHGSKNKVHFDKWIEFLESKGYKNYWQDLNAKNYGIPQNRNRCFMVSMLEDRPFEFPKPFELKLRLKDMLEDEVDEKYYLSDKMIKYISSRMPSGENKITTGININNKNDAQIAGTICTGAGSKPSDNYIIDNEDIVYDKKEGCLCIREATKKGYAEATEGDGVYINRPHQKRGCVQKDIIQTIKTQPNDVGVVVKDTRNMKEILCDKLIESGVVKENDVINHSYTNGLNGNNPNSRQTLEDYIETKDNTSPCLTTRPDTLGVVVKGEINVIGNYSPSGHDASRIVHPDGIAPTVKENHGTVTATVVVNKNLWSETQKQMITEDGNVKRYIDSDIVDEFKEGQVADISFPNGYNKAKRVHDECPTINQTTTQSSFITKISQIPLRIRKLTPKECWRLMGFSDTDHDKAAQFISNAQLYKQAGNSIVVDVLEHIFRELFLKEQDISSWLDKLLEV